jgi:hypothetical protein
MDAARIYQKYTVLLLHFRAKYQESASEKMLFGLFLTIDYWLLTIYY